MTSVFGCLGHLYLLNRSMFVRKKPNKSGVISIQIIDKSQGKYKVAKTVGSSNDPEEIERLFAEAKVQARQMLGLQEIDFGGEGIG